MLAYTNTQTGTFIQTFPPSKQTVQHEHDLSDMHTRVSDTYIGYIRTHIHIYAYMGWFWLVGSIK